MNDDVQNAKAKFESGGAANSTPLEKAKDADAANLPKSGGEAAIAE
jgi:hypothetical protein